GWGGGGGWSALRRAPHSHVATPPRPPPHPRGDGGEKNKKPRGSSPPPHPPPATPGRAAKRELPVERVSHRAFMPPRLPEVMEESPRHLSVSNEPVLHEHTHPGVNFVGGITDVEIGLARHRLGHMHTRGGRAPGVELPERLPGGPPRAVQVVHEPDDVVLHALEPPDRHAELDAALRVRDGLLVYGLAGAHDVRAQERQRPLER